MLAAAGALLLLHPARAQTMSTVYSFGGGSDGVTPQSNLIVVGGKLWGTTFSGGANGNGTVFAIDPVAKSESFLYQFAGQPDGARPIGGVVAIGQTVYGTTRQGGTENFGTVFSIDTAMGTETVINNFDTFAGGRNPAAGLTYAGGTLYGATSGNSSHTGVVFMIDTATGSETALYDLGGAGLGSTTGPLFYSRGILHGVARSVFDSRVTYFFRFNIAARNLKRLWALPQFHGDGVKPSGPLIGVNGAFYGTTENGGSSKACTGGCGTVFGIDPAKEGETFLYSFASGSDGADPRGGVIDEQGILYGTTSAGGANSDGTIFSLDPTTGTETVLASFNGTNGAQPEGALLCYRGHLYGTTTAGGTTGSGTVFEYQPASPLKCR